MPQPEEVKRVRITDGIRSVGRSVRGCIISSIGKKNSRVGGHNAKRRRRSSSLLYDFPLRRATGRDGGYNVIAHLENRYVAVKSHAVADRSRPENADNSENENNRDENVVRVRDVLLCVCAAGGGGGGRQNDGQTESVGLSIMHRITLPCWLVDLVACHQLRCAVLSGTTCCWATQLWRVGWGSTRLMFYEAPTAARKIGKRIRIMTGHIKSADC